ncbi:MAG TPA: putative Ig domain-containing protein, partial [Verrucomicrobiae bacterium]|nr:putative Ig domain-containing protein [Verrucomicrobiae bacterium]
TGAGGGGGGGRSYAEGSATGVSISPASLTATPEIIVVATIATPPTITSASNTTFETGINGSFTITATGSPTPTVSESGTIPAGLIFTSGAGVGSATISGTPSAGTGGSYPITFQASNGFSPSASQNFTLYVDQSPAITSANNATFTDGSSSSVTVTTTGYPTPSLSKNAQALPAGISFTDNGNGTATIGGTPASTGTYSFVITATNTYDPSGVTQAFTLTVGSAPTISSDSSTTFQTGQSGTFTVTTTGSPTPSLSDNGATLPGGVTFTDNGNGTATLAGTPAAGSGGSYSFTITASNGFSPNATQTFVLTVDQAPTVTSAANTTLTVGASGTFTVTTGGYPSGSGITLTQSGALPSGVTFTDNGNGTGTLAGTPAAGTGGTYTFTITAANGVSPNAVQTFLLSIDEPPTITSGGSATFTAGAPGSVTVTTNATAYPVPALSESGALPSGVTFTDNGDGTATLAGTPAATTGGPYPLALTAANGVSPNGTQSFTLTINESPTFTCAATTTFTVGTAGTFTVQTAGTPTAVVTETGTLPGGVTFIDNGNGSGTLSGTPAAGTGGTSTLTLSASNGTSPNGTQAFTLVIDQAPAFTGTNGVTLTSGQTNPITIITTGYPSPTISESGTVPPGLTFTDNGNGTATITGPAPGTGIYSVTLTAANGVGTNATETYSIRIVSPVMPPPPPTTTLPPPPTTIPPPPPGKADLSIQLQTRPAIGGRVRFLVTLTTAIASSTGKWGTITVKRNGQTLKDCTRIRLTTHLDRQYKGGVGTATCSVVITKGQWILSAQATGITSTQGSIASAADQIRLDVVRVSTHPLRYRYTVELVGCVASGTTVNCSGVTADPDRPLIINTSGVTVDGVPAHTAMSGGGTFSFMKATDLTTKRTGIFRGATRGYTTLIGATGYDTLQGGPSAITFLGTGTHNTLDLSQVPSSLTINVPAGTATANGNTDTFTDIQTFIGSAKGHTTFIAPTTMGYAFHGEGSQGNTLDLLALPQPTTGVGWSWQITIEKGGGFVSAKGGQDTFSDIQVFVGAPG